MSEYGAYALPLQMAAQGLATSQTSKAQIEDAYATSAALEFNARVERDRQGLIAKQGAFDERQQRRFARMMIGQSIAQAGGSGLQLSGQRLDIIKHDAVQAELDALRIRENTSQDIRASKRQEKFDLYQSEQVRKQGRKNSRATLLSGALGMANTGLQYYGARRAASGG